MEYLFDLQKEKSRKEKLNVEEFNILLYIREYLMKNKYITYFPLRIA